MLSPMLVQYLVGLCCLKRNPGAVDVIVGDLVIDDATGTARDVDITITMENADGTKTAFKGLEVKREKSPLDVAKVEQLCQKLNDMPAITHRAVVSGSGFTAPAIDKARRHRVELLEIVNWNEPIAKLFKAFEGMDRPPHECIQIGGKTLVWGPRRFVYRVPPGADHTKLDFTTGALDSEGRPHTKFADLNKLHDAMMRRATGVMWSQQSVLTMSALLPMEPVAHVRGLMATPAWPHNHTLDTSNDGIYLRAAGELVKIDSITIFGELAWEARRLDPDYFLLRSVPSGEIFAGAVVGSGREEGEMIAIVFDPLSHETQVSWVRLEEKHWNMIRKLKIDPPNPAPQGTVVEATRDFRTPT